MIRNNLLYKLLALAVALGLWAYVNSEKNPPSRLPLTVPIDVRNLADGCTAEVRSGNVNVVIEGRKSALDGIREKDVSAWVDLRGIKPGRNLVEKNVRIRCRVAGMSDGDVDVSLSPATVPVKIEALRAKRLPVEASFVSTPPLGYAYDSPVVAPATVNVSGKSSNVARVKRVILSVPTRTSNSPVDDYFLVTPVDSMGNTVDEVELNPEKVRLTLRFVEVPATKTVIVSPEVTGAPKFPAKVLRVTVTPASVTLQGKPSVLAGISTVSTDIVSVDGAVASLTRDIALRVPPGVVAAGHSRAKVTVTIGE